VSNCGIARLVTLRTFQTKHIGVWNLWNAGCADGPYICSSSCSAWCKAHVLMYNTSILLPIHLLYSRPFVSLWMMHFWLFSPQVFVYSSLSPTLLHPHKQLHYHLQFKLMTLTQWLLSHFFIKGWCQEPVIISSMICQTTLSNHSNQKNTTSSLKHSFRQITEVVALRHHGLFSLNVL
jgi:hypothetical protein